jgi:hypothetical protein
MSTVEICYSKVYKLSLKLISTYKWKRVLKEIFSILNMLKISQMTQRMRSQRKKSAPTNKPKNLD